MKRQAEQHAEHAGQHADRGELQCIGARNAPLRLAEHAQHGAVVEVAIGEVARRDGHRHRRQQRRQQGHEIEKLGGAVERLAHLGAPALERFEAQAAPALGGDLRFGPGHVVAHRAVAAGALPGQCEPKAHATGRLHQPGGGQVVFMQQRARRKAHEAGAAIGFDRNDRGEGQAGVAEQQRVADAQVERIEDGRVDPHAAARRSAAGAALGGAGRVAQFELAAQRIAVADRLDGHQPRGAAARVGGAAHARKADRARHQQALRARSLGQRLGRRLVAGDDGIAAEQRTSVTRQAVVQAVGKEAHRGERGHRQHHRDDQQPQLAGTEVAPELAARQ